MVALTVDANERQLVELFSVQAFTKKITIIVLRLAEY